MEPQPADAIPGLVEKMSESLRQLDEMIGTLSQNDRRRDALLTYEEGARLLGVSQKKVMRYVRDGEIPAVDLDGSIRIHPDVLAAFIRQRTRRRGR